MASSPRIAALLRDLDAGRTGAVADFWDFVEHTGTPLVEGAGDERIVTFLHRDTSHSRTVLLLVNKLTDRHNLAASRMRPVPGTDIWHRSYRLRSDWRGSYQIAADGGDGIVHSGQIDEPYLRRLTGHAVSDPLNPRWLPYESGSRRSVAELPDAPRTGDWSPCAEAGNFAKHALGDRDVWLYTPVEAAGPLPLIVLLDGEIWGRQQPVAPLLDNLIAQRLIPPVSLVTVSSFSRFTEYACEPSFVDFLAGELVPWVGEQISITADPARTVIAGQSLGGLAAAYAGLRAADRFGLVLAQSGAFWWKSNTPDDTQAEWLSGEFARTPRLPLRFHLQVGLDEWVNLQPNRHLRDVLTARDYPLSYSEFAGGHDRACWRELLAGGFVDLLGRRDD